MPTCAQVEQALLNLQYDIDFDDRNLAKLIGYLAIEGYQAQIVFTFRESYHGELGDLDEVFQMEWLMNDGESCLYLDKASLAKLENELAELESSKLESPELFMTEQLILRSNFDRLLQELLQLSN